LKNLHSNWAWQLIYITDRCHQLEDPWGDRAIAVHFESPEVAAYTVMESLRGQRADGILALGDRPLFGREAIPSQCTQPLRGFRNALRWRGRPGIFQLMAAIRDVDELARPVLSADSSKLLVWYPSFR